MAYPSAQVYPNVQYFLATRQITEDEYRVALGTIKSPRYEAVIASVIGMLVAILVAVAVNFVSEESKLIQLIVPLIFVIIAGSAALRYRSAVNVLRKNLSSGMVAEITGIPVKCKAPRSWSIGPLSIWDTRTLTKVLQEGVTSRIAFIPEAKIVLSVNGIPLKKAASILNMPQDFGKVSSAPAPQPAPAYIPVQPAGTATPSALTNTPYTGLQQEIRCNKCGQMNPQVAKFCNRCGNILQP
jgi:hypothetical protein